MNQKILTEMAWMQRAIADLSEHLGYTTYHISLIKNAVLPEEADAIDKMLFFNAKRLETTPLAELRDIAAQNYLDATGNEWTMSDEIFEELFTLLRQMVKI